MSSAGNLNYIFIGLCIILASVIVVLGPSYVQPEKVVPKVIEENIETIYLNGNFSTFGAEVESYFCTSGVTVADYRDITFAEPKIFFNGEGKCAIKFKKVISK